MINMKFGGAVRSKTPTSQVNEVLAKILCHNICVLIQSFYELGIPLGFPNIDTKQASVSIFNGLYQNPCHRASRSDQSATHPASQAKG